MQGAEETAGLIVQHVFPRFGLPRRFISKRDPKFASRFIQGLCKSTGTTQNISMVYHPRMDGQSEHTNQWLEQYLRFWVNEHQDNWHSYLPLAKFTHNNWPNETTGESPFFILYGFNLHANWINKPSPIPQVALRVEQFKEARQMAQTLMIKVQQSWVKHWDTPKYKEKDLVWLEGRHLCTNQPVMFTPRHLPNGYDYMGKQYLVMDLLSVSTSITCKIEWLDPRIAVVGFRIHEALQSPLVVVLKM